jgi:predicted O-methyltransferase YrrM
MVSAMPGPEQWQKVDSFIEEKVVRADPALAEASEAAALAGLPPIAVSAAQGKLLRLLASAVGARRILEIGTLAGYSTIWLAGALPEGGRLISLEVEPRHAQVARSNLARAGLDAVTEIRLGPALKTLEALAGERREPFDLTFIDADKVNIPRYFDWAVRLSRPGALVIVDNVVRNGAVVDPDSDDPNVSGVRSFQELLAGRDDVSATTIQTVGAKGYDGFTLAVVQG